ncbi:uncharacterized protein TRAVEDRAFT_57839 [Trametes versicolor FP-101664 SS1]|uniref:uncharacterized protein n=1 Tax=Trametes versicolor (strain FP-101664) TaxID=717944 RepID=UPI0004621416|nr:uncharacterized protein TRAVEDRAFT_57839 [Trametes versicolor FP-101664 SS1]EIW60665.1 hypothetical protein TRAVEDRAFT_57839 [Trametes versicolor FP-101664 SS1]
MASVESVPAYLHPGVSVSQPPHLEGDPSFATEILPGPPPLGSIQQVGLPRKDHKKTSLALSYLPASDPGTTYPNHLANILPAAPIDMDGSRRKRARLDKGSERNRSQRASARNLSAAGPMSDPITAPEIAASSSQLPPDYDPLLLPLDSDDAIMSRATTAHAEDSPPETAPPIKRGRGRPVKENGKGKERERDPVVKVKEEPTMVSLGNEVVPSLSNEDHCSACRSFGSLVYCDGCPRAFHLWCLDPPMESADLPEGERWFCPACALEQRPPPKPPASLKFMGPLVHELSSRIPSEFQLPQELRTFFKDVGSSIRGSYLDTSEVKQARLNRHGQLEDRDPYRLKDRNGDPVLCYQCGTSALPPDLAADSPTAKRARRATSSGSSNYSAGRAVISCDYCQLHWHLDCLNPPLVFMPPWNKKWMCPNHAERILLPKRRIPRANATPIEITKPRQWNNGIIEITGTEAAPAPVVVPPKLNVDEVLINGRRYRVPERIITLDFWDKISKNQGGYSEASREVEDSSRMSSPLTSLSSLDDESIPPLSISADSSLYTLDDVRFAELLCGLRLQNISSASDGQTGSNSSSLPREIPQAGAATSQTRIKREYGTLSGDPNELSLATVSPAIEGPSSVRPTRPRRTAVSRTPAPARNRSRAARHAGRSTDEVPMDVDLPELVFSSGKRPDARRKAARPPETSEGATTIAEPIVHTPNAISKAAEALAAANLISDSVAPKRKRSRTSRRRTSPAPAALADTPVADSGRHARSHNKHEASASTHTGKGKTNGATEGGSSTSRSHAKPVTPPTANGQATSTAVVERKPDATPTLKIRLPRLSALNSPSLIPPAPVADAAPKASPAKVAVASTSSRPRRSLRRQASIPTSMNSATTSDASSSARVNETGLAASPIESF